MQDILNELNMRTASLRLFGMMLLLAICGCAFTSKKTATPAADLKARDLEQLPKTPDVRYFLIFFGSNDRLHRPQFSHTSAALIRVPMFDVGGCGTAFPGCIDPALDVQVISWLPSTGVIVPRNYTVEPGRNFGLHETLKLAFDTEQTVDYWGPYEVWSGFAHRFMVQKQFLDSGAVGYQCVDTRGEAARVGNGCDCIHAITDMDPIYPRWRYPLAVYGKAATANLVRRFMHSPIWIDSPNTHAWLLTRLGLDSYKLRERNYIGLSDEHSERPGVLRNLRNR